MPVTKHNNDYYAWQLSFMVWKESRVQRCKNNFVEVATLEKLHMRIPTFWAGSPVISVHGIHVIHAVGCLVGSAMLHRYS